MTKINTILQCFVDLNLEIDENSLYSTNLPEISFSQQQYNVDEGEIVNIDISLSHPSVDGIEEVEVDIVLNNIDLSDFSTFGEIYPKILTFSAGQQTQTISFLANEDLLEDGLESFDVILGFFTNTKPGQIITTTVNIIDKTDLKEVYINEQGGILTQTTPQILEFPILEGATKNIKISLDSPSVLGVESVDVQISNITTNNNDYNSILNTNLTWSQGEQDKILTIQTNQDDEIEDDEFLEIKLINPINVNIESPSIANIKIIDNSPESLYANINIQNSYIQFGGVNAPTVELRNIKDRKFNSPIEDRMFIKYGIPIAIDENLFKAGVPTYTNGDNIITNPVAPLFSNYQRVAVAYFGEKPAINFGGSSDSWSINTNIQKEYGDLRLRIKNTGTHQCIINNQSISVGDSITTIIDKNDFQILLPTNNGLLTAGSFYKNSTLSQDTLTTCSYEFVFEVDFEEFDFKLRNLDNSVSSNKEINIGQHEFLDVYSELDAVLPQNHHNLVTRINKAWPYWESQQWSFPQTGPYCLPAGTTNFNNPQFPNNNVDLQNVIVDGVVFLHQDSSTFNSTNPDKTMYESIYFLPSGQTASSSGCTSVDIEYNSSLNSVRPWTSSIPFCVIN